MRKREKVIVSCAITGAIHTPTMTPHLPLTPHEIAESAIGAARAGAAIVHLHSRVPETGRPAQDPELYGQFVGKITAATDVVINITTGGGLGMSLDERLAPARRFKPELVSLNMGSMNFGIFPPHAHSVIRYTTGRSPILNRPATWSSRTPSRTSRRSLETSRPRKHGSSSSATTSDIFTISPTISTPGW